MKEQYEALLALIRLGIGHSERYIQNRIDWDLVQKLAVEQGLSAVVLDGVERLPNDLRPLKPLLLNWIGEILPAYEQRYKLYLQAIEDLAGWHNKNGFKMMVLKGYACAINWPKPEHRPCGDIDIWQFGQQKDADLALSKEKGVTINKDHHHHTLFYWGDFMVENHYDFLNVYHHKSNMEMEAILKELGKDDSHYVKIGDEKVYLPSANLHALFLLRHSMSNFASSGFQLRQLIDWGFFVEKHGSEIDWNWLDKQLVHFGMKKLYDIFNAICVGDLGFNVNIFPKVQFDPMMKDRVLSDILSPEFNEKENGCFFKRALFKYRRWKANSWKHELCFKETLKSAFWSGVVSHLLKPTSI